MATYVFSDVHGHAATLDRLLSRVSPSSSDALYMLGDMIDRGPDPVRVMKICHELDNCCVLKGNHEDLMLDFLANPHDPLAHYNWALNGGTTTAEGLSELAMLERNELLDWVSDLAEWQIVTIGERMYVLVHAGIVPLDEMPCGSTSYEEVAHVLTAQRPEDLVWVREDFWGQPTGLINKQGEGAIVIAGHTPTTYLAHMADRPDRSSTDERGLCRMIRVGACSATGGVADRWDIDCGCAGGAGYGQLLMLRLDDEREFYQPVLNGE